MTRIVFLIALGVTGIECSFGHGEFNIGPFIRNFQGKIVKKSGPMRWVSR